MHTKVSKKSTMNNNNDNNFITKEDMDKLTKLSILIGIIALAAFTYVCTALM